MNRRHLSILLIMACLPVGLVAQEPLRLTTFTAVEQAMTSNESVLIAGSRRAASRQRIREARSDGLPSIDASVNYTRNWLLPSFVFADQNVKIGSDNNISGNLTLRQPLYTGGRVRGGMKRAESEAQSSDMVRERTRQQIRAQVEAAIYDYLLAADILQVNRIALERAQANLAQVSALHRAGQATEFDLTRARVLVSSAAADSVARESQFALAMIDLKDLIGLPLSQQVVVEAEYRTTTALTTADVEGLVAWALEHRPESRQWRALIQAQAGALGIAKAGGRPSLQLVANSQMQFQNDAIGDATDGDLWRRSWSTGLVLNVPLFDGRRSHAQVAQAQQQIRQLELEQARTIRTIERDVRQAWLDLHDAKGRLIARTGSVAQARKGLDDAETRYRTGRGRQLEVLDAQLSLVEAQTEVARARRDQALALVRLELATGVTSDTAVHPAEGDGQG